MRGSSRRHVATGRPRGRPRTTVVPPRRGEYFTSVGREGGDQEEEHEEEEQQEEQFQGEQSMGGFSAGHQHGQQFFQGESSMGGFSSGHQQDQQFFHGESSMGGFSGGHQQDQQFFQGEQSMGGFSASHQHDQQFFEDQSSMGGFSGGFDSSLHTPPRTQTPWHTPPQGYVQTQDTMPQEMAHDQGKARGQHSHTPLAGFSGFASMSSAFVTPPRATQTQTQSTQQQFDEGEEEQEEHPLRARRGPPRAARQRGRDCGTGGCIGGQH